MNLVKWILLVFLLSTTNILFYIFKLPTHEPVPNPLSGFQGQHVDIKPIEKTNNAISTKDENMQVLIEEYSKQITKEQTIIQNLNNSPKLRQPDILQKEGRKIIILVVGLPRISYQLQKLLCLILKDGTSKDTDCSNVALAQARFQNNHPSVQVLRVNTFSPFWYNKTDFVIGGYQDLRKIAALEHFRNNSPLNVLETKSILAVAKNVRYYYEWSKYTDLELSEETMRNTTLARSLIVNLLTKNDYFKDYDFLSDDHFRHHSKGVWSDKNSTQLHPPHETYESKIQKWQNVLSKKEVSQIHRIFGYFLESKGYDMTLKWSENPVVQNYKNLLVTSAGMPRSGSTWLYNVIRFIIEQNTDKDVAAGWQNANTICAQEQYCVVKIHDNHQPFEAMSNFAFTSHRDPRELWASNHKMWEVKNVALWTLRDSIMFHNLWIPFTDYEVPYEYMKPPHQKKQIQIMASAMGYFGTDINAIERRLLDIQDAKSKSEKDLMHGNHSTGAKWQNLFSDKNIKEIRDEFQLWCKEYNYWPVLTEYEESLKNKM